MTAIAVILLFLAAPESGLQAAWGENPVPFHRPAELILQLGVPISPEDASASFSGAPPTIRLGRLRPRDSSAEGKAAYALEVDALEPGEYALGTITLKAGDREWKASVPPFTARQLTPLEKTAVRQFAPNAGPIDPPRSPWPWALATAALLAAAALLLAWLVQTGPNRNAGGDIRPKTCWDLALARLGELEAQADSPRAFYLGLSEILRDYAAARFDWPIHEWTTPEFHRNATARETLGPETHTRLASVLRQCDLVVYAQRNPAREDMQQSAAAAREVVARSIPAEPQEAAA